uniref:Mitochondrial import inner membrane translocase subunit n=1 Tax=Cyprinus carpio TaxID=7962 RepID=A0A8C2KEL7_CYPCA
MMSLVMTSYFCGGSSCFHVHACQRAPLLYPSHVPVYIICFYKSFAMADYSSSFDMPSASLSENAEAAELQRLIAIEQQKAQFQAQVHNFTDVCWDKCMDKPSSKLDSRTETCLVSCVERFIDTTLTITNRFTQMVQKGAH